MKIVLTPKIIGFSVLLIGVVFLYLKLHTPSEYECLKLGSDSARAVCLEKYHPVAEVVSPTLTPTPVYKFPLNELQITQTSEDCTYGCAITLGIKNTSNIYNVTAISIRVSWSSDKAGNNVIDTGDYLIMEPSSNFTKNAIVAAGTTREFILKGTPAAQKSKWYQLQILSANIY